MSRRDHPLLQIIAIFFGCTLILGAASAKDEIAVIISQDTQDFAINPTILRNIYLKKVFVDEHDQELIPINLPADHPLRHDFSSVMFKQNARELQDYWNQRYFHGITPPFVLGSQKAVVQFVAKTPGAIGYVASCYLDPRVKPVLFLSIPPSAQDSLEKMCPDGGERNE